MFTKAFAALALALTVASSPVGPLGGLGNLGGGPSFSQVQPLFPAPESTTVQQAAAACGEDLTLSCCDDVDNSQEVSENVSALLGLDLNSVLSDIGLFGKCNEISIPVVNVLPINNLLNNKCKQNVACCQNTGQEQTGLVNAGLPCIALSNLLA